LPAPGSPGPAPTPNRPRRSPVDRITGALAARWGCEVRLHRAHPVVATADNYDRLHIAPDAVTRDARYTRYVAPGRVLRTHTTAMIPPLLRELAAAPPGDVLLACPGLAYRRDQIDRLHTGEPHQMDVWRIAARPLGREDLMEMVATLVDARRPPSRAEERAGARGDPRPVAHPHQRRGQRAARRRLHRAARGRRLAVGVRRPPDGLRMTSGALVLWFSG
jgi:tRNA synthetase class II (F)